MKISSGIKLRPRKILFIGCHGVGKSSWASQAPSPIFFDQEEGTGDLDVSRFDDKITGLTDLLNGINWLTQNPGDFKSCVLDTADWINQAITKEIRGGKALNDAKGGFGRGKESVVDAWNLIIQFLDNLRRTRNMATIILAHAKVTKISDPQIGQYDKYTSDLPAEVDSLLQEWADEVFFARSKIYTKSEEIGINKERKLALGGIDREILTCDTASASAKNRCGLPAVMDFPKVGFWDEYKKYLRALRPAVADPAPAPTGNLVGVIVDGSSKKPAPTPEVTTAIAEMETVFGG